MYHEPEDSHHDRLLSGTGPGDIATSASSSSDGVDGAILEELVVLPAEVENELDDGHHVSLDSEGGGTNPVTEEGIIRTLAGPATGDTGFSDAPATADADEERRGGLGSGGASRLVWGALSCAAIGLAAAYLKVRRASSARRAAPETDKPSTTTTVQEGSTLGGVIALMSLLVGVRAAFDGKELNTKCNWS